METLDIEGWYQEAGKSRPIHIDHMQFRLSGRDHLNMEQAEEALLASEDKERFVDADLATLDLHMTPDCGPLSDCQFRVYINSSDQRGHFHLVGHRASDHGLVYSNAMMVDQLQ